MINMPRYRAKCNDCVFETHSYILQQTAQHFAEQHMMKSGHVADVIIVNGVR